MLEIKLNDGKTDIMLRGNDGTFEFCWPVNKPTKDEGGNKTGTTVEWVASRWYASLPSALEALLKMKVSHCDARTLEDLLNELKRIRKELLLTYDGLSL